MLLMQCNELHSTAMHCIALPSNAIHCNAMCCKVLQNTAQTHTNIAVTKLVKNVFRLHNTHHTNLSAHTHTTIGVMKFPKNITRLHPPIRLHHTKVSKKYKISKNRNCKKNWSTSTLDSGSHTQHITQFHTTVAVMIFAKKCYSTAQHKSALQDGIPP